MEIPKNPSYALKGHFYSVCLNLELDFVRYLMPGVFSRSSLSLVLQR